MTDPLTTAATPGAFLGGQPPEPQPVVEAVTGDRGLDHHLAGRYVQRDDMGEGLFTFVRDGEPVPPSLSGLPVLPARKALEAAAKNAAAAAKGSPAA